MKINVVALELYQAERGLNRGALAKLAGISRQSLSAIAKRGTCEPVTLGKLSKALGVAPAALAATGEE